VGQNFGPILATCAPKYTELTLPVRECPYSLQRRFPIDDVLLRSGDNRDQVEKLSEIAAKFHVLWNAKFQGAREGPQVSDEIS